ncbi:tRNA (adenosine(37)-N6)-threonylcarbamoyltransferase complex dimerization subunit type 1 TsaB [Clostridium sp. CX1]|uniref:tRNA (Adenosine(37)-N6)-threonylcarbamoyltransferase complex dimerization subunit type 1 TsaB n=1 Tax=Clostridium tanneri TaxID=3037988 RepID=A0ABU4JPH7_9CLOT|nr:MULTISPECIES: tRNA (adenosine(37)-N6)-threonylcarbamoyltransferase complex dimerization subunit type 1 TsaB [unclassified Clostridium]MCT8976370.1 tRNA (adenosine(37)-N6)-threonylcarbamoyltransferase complex dimerization subunit type 1 TsaB [Clostridium sp. CX1]MDW8800034.1 tRNA (adenosine(37)-N6)-threonylcarbamoyltransferase complex dimerization subunit type 1 TsaB [Clostridium sp. A1-XYC3]
MRILSLDSATESATCAVLEDDRLLGEITFNYKKQHSVVLMSMIDELLKNLKLDISSVDGFVVSKGPGSFTGLRIGAATIKGLSHGTGKPFIGISSLDALAYNLAFTSGIICPILDALRGNVYTALYKFIDNKLHIISEYMVISVDDLISLLNKQGQSVCFVGDAVPKFREKLSSSMENIRFAPAHLNLVKSSSLGELGLELLVSGKHDDLYSFAPFYLRKSQAEREYEKKMESLHHE